MTPRMPERSGSLASELRGCEGWTWGRGGPRTCLCLSSGLARLVRALSSPGRDWKPGLLGPRVGQGGVKLKPDLPEVLLRIWGGTLPAVFWALRIPGRSRVLRNQESPGDTGRWPFSAFFLALGPRGFSVMGAGGSARSVSLSPPPAPS